MGEKKKKHFRDGNILASSLSLDNLYHAISCGTSAQSDSRPLSSAPLSLSAVTVTDGATKARVRTVSASQRV